MPIVLHICVRYRSSWVSLKPIEQPVAFDAVFLLSPADIETYMKISLYCCFFYNLWQMKIHSKYFFFICVTQKEITLFNKLTLGNHLAADKNLI